MTQTFKSYHPLTAYNIGTTTGGSRVTVPPPQVLTIRY